MLFKSLVFLFSVLTFSALAAPTSRIPILKHVGRVKEHSYMVQLKPEASKSTHLARLPTSGLTLAYTYDQAFHGYAARLDTAALEQIRQSQDVEAIYEDGIVTSDAVLSKPDNQTFSTRAIDTRENSSRRDGSSVDVYDIGTGIYTAHTSFGGRAHWGITFGGYANGDGNGYDTCKSRPSITQHKLTLFRSRNSSRNNVRNSHPSQHLRRQM
ncbi:unnamed protein product [Rhizoctonia solani]|uniref:Inhibitor I9 domain-containing protein n=1 Tax=Rhizoctonia solani TaxID=456999 RepID=A0A8H3D9D7_9AGAM|nr:unnamed protein product [Rhizoctonia solani]